MIKIPHEDWYKLAINSQWETLLKEINKTGETKNLSIKIWQIRALRALGRGEDANTLLEKAATGQQESNIETALQIAEELVQCAMFKQLSPLLEALSKANIPAVDFIKAAAFREQGKYSLAIKSLAPLYQRGGEFENLAKLGEAWIRIRQGWLNRAEECLREFQSDQSLPTQKLIARFEIAAGKINSAKERLKAVATRQPLDWEWPHLLAAVLASQGENLEKCIEMVMDGLSKQPRHSEAWALLVKLRLATGNNIAAKEAMMKSLLIKPWQDAAVIPLIEQAAEKRNYKEAEELLQQVSAIANTPRRRAIALDLMRMKGAKKKDTISLAEKLSEEFSDDPDVLRSCAAAFLSANQLDPAAKLLERIQNLNPYDVGARNNLANLYRDRGDLDDAIHLWRTLIDEGNGAAEINLAQALIGRGDFVEGRKLWEKIEQNTKGEFAILERAKATIYVKSGELQKALEHANKACELEPSYSQNWLMKAQLFSQLNGPQSACEILESIEDIVNDPLKLRQELFLQWRKLLTVGEICQKVSKWRKENPNEIEYYMLEASAYHLALDFEREEQVLQEAVAQDEKIGTVSLVRFLIGRSRFGAARKLAKQWVRSDPSDIRRWAQLAEVYFLENNPEAALEAVNEGLKCEPLRTSLVRQKVGILLSLERYADAEICTKTLWENKKEISVLAMWLRTIERAGEFQRAVQVVQDLLEIRPNDQALRLRLARQLRLAGNLEESVQTLFKLHMDEPDSDVVVQRLVQSLMQLDMREKALEVINNFSNKYSNRSDLRIAIANLALEQGLIEEAREITEEIRNKQPEMLESWITLALIERRASCVEKEKLVWRKISEKFEPSRWIGNAIQHWIRLGLDKELEAVLNRWREREPNNPAPWWAGFNAARKSSRYKNAEIILDGIEKRTGKTSEVLAARANLLSEQWRMNEASKLIEQACALSPIDLDCLESKIAINLKFGNWNSFEKDFERLSYLSSNKKYELYGRSFFNLNCHPSWTTKQLFHYYREWGNRVIRPRMMVNRKLDNHLDKDRKLRIGYISPDFRMHAVAKFSFPIISAHQKNGFELFGYAHLENGIEDNWTEEFKKKFDHWRAIQYWSLDELENTIRKDQIDILIDLAGHTSNNKLDIFLRRVAPIQASHIIGAGQTTGMPCVDYLIATENIWPKEDQIFASEQVERIPFPGLVFKLPEDAPLPNDLPFLQSKKIVFGVFARPVRISDRNVRIWSQILHQVPDSVLRFEHAPYLESDIQERYLKIFGEMGIEKNRIEFKNTRPYWQAFQEIDIQLDAFPAGSGTTATEGLFMGRLVMVRRDRPAMGRTAFTQIAAMGLEEHCSSDNDEDYITKVVNLANDKDLLINLSTGLRERFLKSPIMDYEGYAKILAATYRKWWKQYCQDQLLKEKVL